MQQTMGPEKVEVQCNSKSIDRWKDIYVKKKTSRKLKGTVNATSSTGRRNIPTCYIMPVIVTEEKS